MMKSSGRGSASILTTVYLLASLPGMEDYQGVAGIKIMTQGQTFTRLEHDNITLPCSVNGIGDAVLTWYRGDQVLTANNFIVLQDKRLSVLTSPGHSYQLHITGVSRTDQATYTCVVNNKDELIKVSHQLNVHFAPTVHPIHYADTIPVHIGFSVRLDCNANGNPQPKLYWRREFDKPFSWEPPILQVEGGILELQHVRKEDSGRYLCFADNGIPLTNQMHSHSPQGQPANHTESMESIKLNVLFPPEVVVPLGFNHVALGQVAVLTCQIQGNPEPKVTWYKGTMKINDGERLVSSHVGSTHRLVIQPVQQGDYSVYTCRADNNSTKEPVVGSLTLSGCPTPPLVHGEKYSSQLYSYDLGWSVQSAYPLRQHQITLYARNQPVQKRPESELSAASSPPNLQAQNEEVKKIVLSGESLHRGSNGSFTYNIKGLSHNRTYSVVVRSRNEFGWGPESKPWTFHMLQPEKQPMEIKIGNTLTDIGSHCENLTGARALIVILIAAVFV